MGIVLRKRPIRHLINLGNRPAPVDELPEEWLIDVRVGDPNGNGRRATWAADASDGRAPYRGTCPLKGRS
jgi:hypothetical protein